MMIKEAIEEQVFLEVSESWNLELLYQKLADVKQVNISRKAKLSPVEKAMLRGLLAGNSPKLIASELHWTSASVGVELTKGIYRYVEALTDRDSNTLKSWRDVAKWIEEAGYKKDSIANQLLMKWRELPEATQFYGREAELDRLQQWIVNDRDRLVIISGMVGIGKTALATQLTQKITSDFDFIIWRDLNYQSSLSHLLEEVLSLFPRHRNCQLTIDVNTQITRLLAYLRQYRCLLILDGLENTMSGGNFAGFYQKEDRQYSQLIKRIATESHQSCLLVTSQEEPIELPLLPKDRINMLKLQGLEIVAANKILSDRNLAAPQSWHKLFYCYSGNPLALKLIAATIQQLFNGDVLNFINANQEKTSDLIPIYFKDVLEAQLSRLSNLEIKILCCLANNHKPICFTGLQKYLALDNNNSELIQALSSLSKRSLLEVMSDSNNTYFTIQNILKSYLVNC
jgi:hypothetical protein